jgi:hypothetical protein
MKCLDPNNQWRNVISLKNGYIIGTTLSTKEKLTQRLNLLISLILRWPRLLIVESRGFVRGFGGGWVGGGEDGGGGGGAKLNGLSEFHQGFHKFPGLDVSGWWLVLLLLGCGFCRAAGGVSANVLSISHHGWFLSPLEYLTWKPAEGISCVWASNRYRWLVNCEGSCLCMMFWRASGWSLTVGLISQQTMGISCLILQTVGISPSSAL